MSRTYRRGPPRKGRPLGHPRRENSARDWHPQRVDERKLYGALREAQERFDYLTQEE